MTDRYKCGPKTQTQIDKIMINRYRCGLKTQTKHKLIGRWLINIGAVPKTQNSN